MPGTQGPVHGPTQVHWRGQTKCGSNEYINEKRGALHHMQLMYRKVPSAPGHFTTRLENQVGGRLLRVLGVCVMKLALTIWHPPSLFNVHVV